METITITVPHYFNHHVLYPFMTEGLFEILQDAFLHNEITVKVPKHEFEHMIEAYLDTLKN